MDEEHDGLLVGFDESQWASSAYVMCATSIDCVITLTLVLFSFTGTLQSALVPAGLGLALAVAINLLDLVILAMVRVFNVSLNLMVPNTLCVAAHFVSFVFNVVNGIYAVVKLSLLLKFSHSGVVETGGTQVSVAVVILALIQGQAFAWLEWWMAVRYRSTLSKIITKAYSRRISDLTAYEIASQSNRTPMDRVDRWNSNPSVEPLLDQLKPGDEQQAYQLPQLGSARHRPNSSASVSDVFEFQDAVSELSTLRSVGGSSGMWQRTKGV